MKIIVEIKNAYGNELIYPICNNAKLFAKMVNQKVLTKQNLIIIAQLGYEIELVHKELTLKELIGG